MRSYELLRRGVLVIGHLVLSVLRVGVHEAIEVIAFKQFGSGGLEHVLLGECHVLLGVNDLESFMALGGVSVYSKYFSALAIDDIPPGARVLVRREALQLLDHVLLLLLLLG